MSSIHHIEISSVDPKQPLHPGNCQVLMDGKKMLGVRAVSLSRIGLDKDEIAVVTLEVLASVKVSGKMAVEIEEQKDV